MNTDTDTYEHKDIDGLPYDSVEYEGRDSYNSALDTEVLAAVTLNTTIERVDALRKIERTLLGAMSFALHFPDGRYTFLREHLDRVHELVKKEYAQNDIN